MFSSHGDNPAVGCVDCHPAHEAFEAALPLDILPTPVAQSQGQGYDYYSSNSSCLGCHNSAALFGDLREGFVVLNTVNYHELHVMQGQSLCIECHEPHGSMFRSLLRGRLLDGSSFSFRPGIGGGSCSVRCHGVEHDNWSYVSKVY
jgi:predicted CXXCH cytochrome family protein